MDAHHKIETTEHAAQRKAPGPLTIVIFGITGDLSKRKLLPALLRLFERGNLPQEFSIIGFSRREMEDDDLRAYVRDSLGEKGRGVEAFLKRFSYVGGDFGDLASYRTLAKKLRARDEGWGRCGDKLLHLAVPPSLYGEIFEHLHASGLSDMCAGAGGWTRLLVEKPFGNDLETAGALDRKLGSLFHESQVFRVDHYLGKEAMQNILAFRFANSLLEPLWRASHIERVYLRLFEEVGVEGRGAFYDGVGALRDVGENHLLQMLALVAMEDPKELSAPAIRKARAEVLEALRVPSQKDAATFSRGQYRGYRQERDVAPDSQTETYFKIEAFVDNERWRGTPFLLESGKKMGEARAEVEVLFRESESCLCPPGEESHRQNKLVFRIQPDEGISISFWAKHPGFGMRLEEKVLSFLYKETENMTEAPDAYERVIFDGIMGDQTLFTSTKEVLASWRFITPIVRKWEGAPVFEYETGFIPGGG